MLKQKTKILLAVLVCIYLQVGNTQVSEVDSLLDNIKTLKADSSLYRSYAQLFRLHYRRDLQKSKVYLDKELEHAEASNRPELIAAAKNHEGIYSGMSGNDQRAVEVFGELLTYYSEIEDEKKVAAMHQNISSSLLAMGKIQEAMEQQMIALRMREEQGVKGKSLGNAYFTLANIHRQNEDYAKSNLWLKKSIVEYESDEAFPYIAQAEYTIAINYMRLDSAEQAKSYHFKALEFFRAQNNKIAMTKSLMGLGKLAYLNDNLSQATTYLNEANGLVQETKDVFSEMEILLELGQLKVKRKNYGEAIDKYESALEIAKSLNNDIYLSKIYLRLAEYSEVNGDYLKSIEYYKRYNEKFEQLTEANNKADIAELELKYETEKKENQIALLKEKSKRDELVQKGMLGGLLALLLTFGSILYSIRTRMKKNKLEKEKLDQALQFADKELELKKAELTGYALQIAHKNEVLSDIKNKVTNISKAPSQEVRRIVNSIDINQNNSETWEGFRRRFKAIHKDFEEDIRQKYPNVTSNDLRLMSLMKMNLSTKEIANILNITPDGVKKAKYRLRKKLGSTLDLETIKSNDPN